MEKHIFSIAKIRQKVKFSVYVLVASIIFFIFFEGLCSIFFVLKSIHRPMAERVHTKYDEWLGWVNIPNILIKDMYGAGVYLRTNSQGFRSDTDFPTHIPRDKIRVVCSGDSFTLGYGVDNDHTWCKFLTSIDKRIETVNMGQGGYGIDQAYLWYMRDGIKLEHQIHIFAITSLDFHRFGKDAGDYSKPYLKLQNNLLIICNVPVPKRPFYLPWLTENSKLINELKSVKILRAGYNKLLYGRKESFALNEVKTGRVLAIKIFEDLLRINKSRNNTLVIIYLPTMRDLTQDNSSELRAFLSSELSKRNIVFIDLFDDFKRISSAEIQGMFIKHTKYPLSAGHYSVKGNQYVADMIYKRLLPFLVSEFEKLETFLKRTP